MSLKCISWATLPVLTILEFNKLAEYIIVENWKSILIAVASTGLFSLVPIVAIAGSSTSVTLEQKVQKNVERQLAAEGNKYSRIVSLAGNRKDELKAKEYEAINAYRKWRDLTIAVESHYPSSDDYSVVEAAANAYSNASKAFIDLQKRILAENGARLDTVSIRTLNAVAQTAVDTK